MKHPKYRIADILDMDSQVRDEVFNYVRKGVKDFLPKGYVKDIMLVGSYAFGCASLSSDFDFNLSCDNKKKQKELWNVWTKEKKIGFSRYFDNFFKLWGVNIDFHYNENEDTKSEIYYSLKDNKIYNRIGVVKQTLRWNAITNSWDKLPSEIKGKWVKDEWANDIVEWKTKYGRNFIDYKRVGNTLIQE